MLVFLAESTTILQHRDHITKAVKPVRLHINVDIEAVAHARISPLDNRVGNLFRGAKNSTLTAGQVMVNQLFDREFILARDATDILTTIADDVIVGGMFFKELVGQLFVQVKLVGWDAE